MNLHKIDEKISEIGKRINFYSRLTPLNREEEKDKFFAALREGKTYNPVFSYGENNYEDEKKELTKLSLSLNTEDDLEELFIKKINFILNQIALIGSGDSNFAGFSIKLYGAPKGENVKLAREILEKSKKEKYIFPEEVIIPDEVVSIFRKEIEDKKIGWKVKLSSNIIPKMSVSAMDKTLYVNSRINYTKEEIQRLLVHEIQAHIYRGANGALQPFRIFAEGLSGYDKTEEGLGVVLEEKAGCLEIDTRQMKLYAARTLSVENCLKNTFYEAFVEMKEFFPDYLAYRLTERAKRGMKDTSKKGADTRGLHYISGRSKVRKYIEAGGDLSILYVGKIGLGDVEIAGKMLDKGVLKPPEYLPEFLRLLRSPSASSQ